MEFSIRFSCTVNVSWSLIYFDTNFIWKLDSRKHLKYPWWLSLNGSEEIRLSYMLHKLHTQRFKPNRKMYCRHSINQHCHVWDLGLQLSSLPTSNMVGSLNMLWKNERKEYLCILTSPLRNPLLPRNSILAIYKKNVFRCSSPYNHRYPCTYLDRTSFGRTKKRRIPRIIILEW